MRSLGFTLALAAGLVLSLSACGDDDGGVDSGRVDGGPRRDGGPRPDGTVPDRDGGPRPDGGPPPPCGAPVIPALATELITTDGFNSPIFVTQAPGSSDTLWVVERGGRIRLVRDGSILPAPFLDISSDIVSGGEQGLLGLAFHPDYAANGRFFVYYTEPDNVVAEYHRSAGDPDVADGAEDARLIDAPDSEGNHNGGMIAFGPDGFLYVGMGDEGGGCDGHGDPGNGQSTDTFMGKLHRLDVDNAGGGYAAAGNPFAGGGGLPQIWAYGLRNPWRFSFDRVTGDLYIGDVGQGTWEEIDFQPMSSSGGENYGWRFWEGMHESGCNGGDDPSSITHTEPILEVRHGDDPLLRGACSIDGGYVYRGSAIPELVGTYLFGDYCSSDVGALVYCDGALQGSERVGDISGIGTLVSFGEDNQGELYMVFLDQGEVHKIVPAP